MSISQAQNSKKRGSGDEWYTPRRIIDALGPFDLDPCAAPNLPWRTAERQFDIYDNGLLQQWDGFVWLNPPFSNCRPFVERLAEHGHGIGLTPASTGCTYWQETVFPNASQILFVNKRIKFVNEFGLDADFTAGFYVALFAFGKLGAERLRLARERES